MTDYFVGPGGNDGNSGLTWALRKLTLDSADSWPVGPGDVINVGPGVYRESLTARRDGGNTYAVGTITVTQNSTTVTGAGTAFLANVAATYLLQVRFFATGNDGVANGTATFTSAAGNFQANMVGKVIQIMTRGAYTIGAVAAVNSITLVDPNGLGWPAAGGGLTYSIMSGEGPYEIASVTDNANFELVRPWSAPTLTGLAYLTYWPVRWIADVTGRMTDDVGGEVRWTGSDNDQTDAGRGSILSVTEANYTLWRGIHFDFAQNYGVWIIRDYATFEDCAFRDIETQAIRSDGHIYGAPECITIRRCYFYGVRTPIMFLARDDPEDDSGHVIENCYFIGASWYQIYSKEVGGITVKNCGLMAGGTAGIRVAVSPNLGQTLTVYNCILMIIAQAMRGVIVGDITEDYNDFFNNSADRTNVAVGANSISWGVVSELPLLLSGYKFPWWAGELSEWSQLSAAVGHEPPLHDLQGFGRPVTAAKRGWGALQFTDAERETGTVHRGSVSMVLADAGRVQFKVPVTNNVTTVSVWVYREANYAGVNPQMIIKQPGQVDRVTLDAGAAGAWNRLIDSFTPAALPPYIIVELVSDNTAAAGNYDVFFDTLNVFSGRANNTGDFEEWIWDRQPFSQYGKITSPVKLEVTRGDVFREVNAQGDLIRLT